MRHIILIILFVFVTEPVFAIGSHFWFGKTMITPKAKVRWGGEAFVLERFKNGSPKDRAKMTAALVRGKKAWIGRPMTEIHETFGQHDGFYWDRRKIGVS